MRGKLLQRGGGRDALRHAPAFLLSRLSASSSLVCVSMPMLESDAVIRVRLVHKTTRHGKAERLWNHFRPSTRWQYQYNCICYLKMYFVKGVTIESPSLNTP